MWDFLKVILLIFGGQWLVLRIYRQWKFNDVSQEFWAKFNQLTYDEKVDLAFAIHGKRLTGAYEDLGHASRRSNPTHREIDLDFGYEALQEQKKKVPDFRNADDLELVHTFAQELKSEWCAMTGSGDFDFHDMRAQFNALFEKRESLAKIAKREKGIEQQ